MLVLPNEKVEPLDGPKLKPPVVGCVPAGLLPKTDPAPSADVDPKAPDPGAIALEPAPGAAAGVVEEKAPKGLPLVVPFVAPNAPPPPKENEGLGCSPAFDASVLAAAAAPAVPNGNADFAG